MTMCATCRRPLTRTGDGWAHPPIYRPVTGLLIDDHRCTDPRPEGDQ